MNDLRSQHLIKLNQCCTLTGGRVPDSLVHTHAYTVLQTLAIKFEVLFR